MNEIDVLMIIAISTIVMTIIQCIEMMILIHNQRYTNTLLENVGHLASDGFFQFINDIAEDKKKEAAFFGFVNVCGQHAVASAREKLGPVMPKRIKGLGDVIQMFFSMPGASEKIGEIVTKKAGAAATETVKDAVNPGWGV